jgi:hypothetical protein
MVTVTGWRLDIGSRKPLLQPRDEELCVADIAAQQHGLTPKRSRPTGTPARRLTFNAGQLGHHVPELITQRRDQQRGLGQVPIGHGAHGVTPARSSHHKPFEE